MRKFKGKLFKFLALTLTVSLLTLPEMAVFASANQGVLGSPGKIMSAERFSHATGSDAGMDEGTLEDSKDDVENGEDEEKKVATWANALTGAVSKAKSGEREIKLDGAKVEEEAAMTLLPIEEVDAYLSLSDLSDEELKAVPIETILERLKDSNGKSIQFPDDVNVVLIEGYSKYHAINPGETLDLSPYYTSDSGNGLNREEIANIELMIGSGKQLDANNIRYHVSIYFSDIINEYIEYWFCPYEKQENGRDKDKWFLGSDAPYHASNQEFFLDGIDVPTTLVQVYTENYELGKEYYFWIESDIASGNIGVQVDVYPMKNFVDYYQNGKTLEGKITSQVLSLPDNEVEINKGIIGTFEEHNDYSDLSNIDNLFCIVYTDANTGRMIGFHGILVMVVANIERAPGEILFYENGQMKPLTKRGYENKHMLGGGHRVSRKLNLVTETNGAEVTYINEVEDEVGRYALTSGDSIQDVYYCVLDDDEHIEKVVVGYYETIEDAENAGAKDVTAQVFPSDRSIVPYGYPIYSNMPISSGDIIAAGNFTIFFDNGEVLKKGFMIWYQEDSAPDPVPDSILDFQVTGVEGYDENNTYIVKYDDSLFSYKYNGICQALWISSEDIDLTKVKLKFHCKDGVRIFANGEEQKSGTSEQDFSNGAVYYTSVIGDEIKNYYVSVMKKENGSKLFVNGPDERSVFLDSYYGNQHDILIANVGNEALTGLKVELLDAVNIKLDDYWVIGGEHNDTLAAFNFDGKSDDLSNMAKVRILPDGEGDLSGTLKVSADGQDDVYIKLIGHVGNPKIITESLIDAVQYVPYSYMVATNNLFDWNKVTFEIREGKLPDGLQLNSATGEIYGVPRESGEFPVKIQASYAESQSPSSSKEYLLTVKEPSNETVFLASDKGYEVLQPIGTEIVEGTYEYVIRSFSDQLFVSAGEYSRFVDLWLNGERLTDEVDYTKESGSTKITVKSQTFKDKAKKGSNTIAAEFRESDKSNELKRTAQNFTLDVPETNENPSGNNPSNIGGSTGSGGNGGSGGGGSSRRSNDTTSTTANQTDISLYRDDSWVKDEIGWRCKMPDGNWITNTWFRLPYQGTVEWYYFNEQGYMVTGLLAHNGLLYYLNPISDGTQGKMITGWKMIDGKWYYFKEIDDGTMGAMMSDVWIGEYYVNSQGIWEE